MGKKLSEMTLEELWRLFPVYLTPHNALWKNYYNETAEYLGEKLKGIKAVRISHIGSTAIAGIWAKPIVDILVEINEEKDFSVAERIIETGGFNKMSATGNRISFNKGYTEKGFEEKVYHLHLRRNGDNDELYFRDYLIENADIAKEYERLKLDLWRKFEFNRDGYTLAKSEFIKRYTVEAKLLYKDRY